MFRGHNDCMCCLFASLLWRVQSCLRLASIWFIYVLCRLLADFNLHIAVPFARSEELHEAWCASSEARLNQSSDETSEAREGAFGWRSLIKWELEAGVKQQQLIDFVHKQTPRSVLPTSTHTPSLRTRPLSLFFYSIWANTVNLSAARLLALHIFRPQREKPGLNKDQLTTINTPESSVCLTQCLSTTVRATL